MTNVEMSKSSAEAALQNSPDRPRGHAGFTLLEAIIALAILALAGLTLFTLIIESQRNIRRADDAFRDAIALEQAELWLRGVNPSLQPQGTATLGNLSIGWRSEPVIDPADNLNFGEGPGSYRVALYRLKADVRRGTDGPLALDLLQAGWQVVRQTQDTSIMSSEPPKAPAER